MDMKRILQAMDGVATKPVEGADSMAKFLRLVKEADLNQPVAAPAPAPAPATPQQDPNFAKYAELMAKYDMLAAEMTPDASGVAKNASPEFVQQVNALKAQADQLAGANAQAWDQARKAGSAPQQTQQQLATQLSEGANPHKVSLPVQMAMQHYQKPQAEKKSRPSLIDKYFTQVEAEHLQEKQERRAIINQYASTIAKRVLMKESALKNKDDLQAKRKALQDIQLDKNTHKDPELKAELARRKAALEKEAKEKGIGENFNPNVSPNPGFKPGAGPGIQSAVAENENAPDVVSVDIPLLIRLLEYAREDAKTDMDLHNVAERLIGLSQEGATLSMDNYNDIVGQEETMSEMKTIKPKRKSDPCWSGYHQVGMKKSGNQMVPNCTKKSSHKPGNEK